MTTVSNVDLFLLNVKTGLENNHCTNPLVLSDPMEIDQVGLADTKFDIYAPLLDRRAYVQIGRQAPLGRLLAYADGTAVFCTSSYENLDYNRWPSADPRPQVSGALGRPKIRWWRFGCRHHYRDLTDAELIERRIILRRCEHVVLCEKCGHVWSYDTGD